MPQKQGEGKIDWTDHSSNVIKGRCGFAQEGRPCNYCYAEDLWKRFSFRKNGDVFWDQELRIDEKELAWSPKKPSKIFLCSMTDLMHPLVPLGLVGRVVDMIASRPQNIYQVLTKCPENYDKVKFPENAWLGATVDGSERTRHNFYELATVRHPGVKFISFEPLIAFPESDWKSSSLWMDIDWIIIGGDSRRGAATPPVEWAHFLIAMAREHDVAVWIKENYPPLGGSAWVRPKEFPV